MLCHSLSATPSNKEISVLQPRAEHYGQLGQKKWPSTQKLWIDNLEDAGNPTLPYPTLCPRPCLSPEALSERSCVASAKGRGKVVACKRERECASLQFSSCLCSSQSCLISFFLLRRCSYSCCCTQVGFWFVCVFSFFFSFCREKLVYYGLARHGIFSRSFRARASHDAAADGNVFVGFVREDGVSSAFWSAAEDLAGGCGHGEASRLRRGNAG